MAMVALEQDGLLGNEAGGARGRGASRSQQQSAEYEEAGVKFEVGMYSAVLVAAFGGVTSRFLKTEVKIHPLFLLLLIVPLFTAQFSAIMALRLDVDLEAPVRKFSVEMDKETETSVLLPLKLILIFILQIMNFEYLLTNIRLLIFTVNPISWIEISTPGIQKWIQHSSCMFMAPLFRPYVLAPCACFSLILRFTIGYLVCVDSVSIVFESDNVKDALFNSLAISFIADLSSFYWQAVETIFHIESLDQFSFKVRNDAWTDDDELSPEVVKQFACPGLMQCIVRRLTWLRRGKGFKSLESALTMLIMIVVYCQQVFTVAFALQTNVLPVARDVCTMWRWMHGEAAYFHSYSKVFERMIAYISLVDIETQIDKAVEDIGLAHACDEGGHYYRIVWSDRIQLFWTYPAQIGGCIIVILFLLFGPIVGHMTHSAAVNTFFVARHVSNDDEKDEAHDDEIRQLWAELKQAQTEIQSLRSELHQPR